MSASPPAVTRLQPRLGEHTAEVLRECGFDDSGVQALTSAGGACAAEPF